MATHIPLLRILDNTNLLSKDELKYVRRDWTHIDFVIYNKMDKKPVLAVELTVTHFIKNLPLKVRETN